jgi:hypothetical protein
MGVAQRVEAVCVRHAVSRDDGFHQHVCTSDGPGHYHRQSSAFTHSHIKRLLLHMHLNLHGGMS